MRTPADCPHETVLIKRVIKAMSNGRVLGGECQKCGGTVERTQHPIEFRTGVPQGWWELSNGLG